MTPRRADYLHGDRTLGGESQQWLTDRLRTYLPAERLPSAAVMMDEITEVLNAGNYMTFVEPSGGRA